jgi:phosphopantothenoylcysteine decarboxylase/phosphopantothenate--cysteine ligase
MKRRFSTISRVAIWSSRPRPSPTTGPRRRLPRKSKKERNPYRLTWSKTPTSWPCLGEAKKEHPCILVGFAAETQDLLENAQKKINAKNLDMIVANDVSREDAGFQTDTNAVKIIYADGRVEDSPLMGKIDVAHMILDRAKA